MDRLGTVAMAVVKCCYLQWLNVRPANVSVANWRLITSELPHVYSLCSDCHLLGVAEVIIDVFMSLKDQPNDDDNDGYNTVWLFVHAAITLPAVQVIGFCQHHC